jgi:hypothetical protein
LVKFSQALEAEYGAKGIRVTAVCPGFTKTEFAKEAGVHEIMQSENRRLWQTSEQVVEETLRANDAGKLVLVPGWHNKVAAALMNTLPGPLVRALISAGSAKYHLEDQA